MGGEWEREGMKRKEKGRSGRRIKGREGGEGKGCLSR